MDARTDPLTPVAPGERIVAMDAVRGFALLGILLMNIEGLVGPLFGSITGVDPALTGADKVADTLVYLLVQGKFYTLFSLLFGMGFAVMLARSEAARRPFTALYLRRTFALLAIGLLHLLLVWSGDILVTYALVALVLLLFRDTPVGRLPVWGVALYLLPAVIMLLGGAMGSLARLDPAAAADLGRGLDEQARAMGDTLAAQRATYGGTDYRAAMAQRWADFRLFLGFLPLTGLHVLGMFLLGMWFVRRGAIQRPAAMPRLYAWLRWGALPLGLVAMVLSWSMVPTVDFARMDIVSGVASALASVASLLMCLGYLAWLVRGLQAGGPVARVLGWLAPAGRMALTNYLAQSLACTAVFAGYGLGYFEQLPRAWQVPFAFVLFAAQVVASRAWLARFRYGPAEWVWRALTYGRRPPMRIAPGAA